MNDDLSMNFLDDPQQIICDGKELERCLAVFSSKIFCHQELLVFNPKPTKNDQNYCFPRDVILCGFNRDRGDAAPSIKELKKLRKRNAIIKVIASHEESIDRSFQLILTPENQLETFLVLSYLGEASQADKEYIAFTLMQV